MEHAKLFEIFAEIDVLKCPLAKPIPTHTSYAGYRPSFQVFSPSDLEIRQVENANIVGSLLCMQMM